MHNQLEPAVAWKDVAMVYPGGFVALESINLEVQRGEVLALLGTSGSGKSTLLKTVNRLIEPTRGRVTVAGTSVEQLDPIALRRSTGYVIQEVGLLPHLTVLANAGLVLRLGGRPRSEQEAAARHWLARVRLDPDRYGSMLPHQLSGGQRQRVGVARALAAEPDLLLMDEPFGALDPITRREIQREFRDLQRELGKTVLLVTHDIREACRMADRLALMDRGRLVQVGSPEELHEKPATDFVRAFFEDAGAVELNREAET